MLQDTESMMANQVAVLQAENERLRTLAQAAGVDPDMLGSERVVPQANGGAHAFLLDPRFIQRTFESSNDCIKVLGLDGGLLFMSDGGLRVMEIDDFATVNGCPWVSFWSGDQQALVRKALDDARLGGTGHFRGPANTAKGSPRWWDVTVTPIFGADGRPAQFLSISRDITKEHEAEAQREILFEEMHHRVKNTLATVISITRQSLRSASTLEDAGRSIETRLVALSQAHDLLVRNQWTSARMEDVVTDAVRAYVGERSRMRVSGEPLVLASGPALTTAMLVNELCTNATKHGAWSNNSGTVEIEWSARADRFHFRWAEQGGPTVVAPTRRGFGTRLIQSALPAALDGKATVDYAPGGMIFQLEAPMSALTASAPVSPGAP